MIDRITIYIDDVKFEDVEKRLGLTPSKVAEDESLIYSSLISNLRFTYKGNRLTITGSLHKYAKGQMPMAVTRRIPMHMNKGKNHFPESGRQNGLCEESGEDGQR